MHFYKIESGYIQVDDRDIYIGSHIMTVRSKRQKRKGVLRNHWRVSE